MLVAVNEFGSIWTRRFGKGGDSPTRHTRDAVFYNTTGVPVGDKIRARNRVYGVARFNGSAGFSAHNPERMLHRVFECAEPCTWNGGNQVLFRRLQEQRAEPSHYLMVIRDDPTGWVDRRANWKSPEAFLISLSESDLHQELMLLMTPFSWIRTAVGVFVLEPDATRPWRAQLVLDRRI
jgi:hypothetical protein